MTVNFDDFIERANMASGLLQSVPDEIRAKLIEFFKILENKTMETAEKQAKIDKLIGELPDEKLQGFLKIGSFANLKIADWAKGRLQKEDAVVREACRNTIYLLNNHEFITAADNVKRQKLNSIVSGLNENQLMAYLKFKTEADEVGNPANM